MEVAKQIGGNIKEARKLKGLTQSDVAKVFRMTQQQYSRFENGVFELNYEQILKICEILDKDGALVVMGDFNALPHAQEIQPLYDRMICAADEKNNTDFTFASYNPYMCIDYIFVKKGVEINSFVVHKEKASDHYPISVVLDI